MWKKIQKYLRQKNYEGVFVPFISDPKSRYASATLSQMVISFIIVIISLFTDKINNSNALTLFVVSAGFYLGRKITNKDVEAEQPTETKKEK